MDRLARFEAHRPRLLGLAYRLLGEASEAEDVVQETYLRWDAATGVEMPEAWLTKVVTNLCLNRLTSARARRETYTGPWLPEPVFTDRGELGPLETAEQRDTLSLGMLVLLERLTPPERAAFVLREAFGYSHREIGEILDRDEAHVRQLCRRARQHVGEGRKRFPASPEDRRRITERFLAAAVEGDVPALERLLAADVVAWSDGGGKVTAARRPVSGRDKVARYLTGLARDPRMAAMTVEPRWVNGECGVVIRQSGTLFAVLVPEPGEDGLVALHTMLNPDKLTFAGSQKA
ncbi:RNA polymerase sigma factor SigJ [Amycolatopsis endophytica]|uniref:RNA polymerase sigma-70 factor (ECF subfamily) n=1 Tax=Amycolatopsis endophytica TaxID=860233 RepID=A0A853BFQ1_9PSEU|nr:RNA polymerase sigma-70 factor [Amycolatopsis endophytica]NYI93387.1 RNA polymerase sigma-70 factor (ECF subfamily) [Amycolatopsis endophytica]